MSKEIRHKLIKDVNELMVSIRGCIDNEQYKSAFALCEALINIFKVTSLHGDSVVSEGAFFSFDVKVFDGIYVKRIGLTSGNFYTYVNVIDGNLSKGGNYGIFMNSKCLESNDKLMLKVNGEWVLKK